MSRKDQRAEAVFAANRVSGLESACRLWLELGMPVLDGVDTVRGTPDHLVLTYIEAFVRLSEQVEMDVRFATRLAVDEQLQAQFFSTAAQMDYARRARKK